MDPNATLQQIRQLTAGLLNPKAKLKNGWAADARELAELVDALDQWLSSGGFLPSSWVKGKLA
jgi:hypothetical protein